MTSVPRPSGSPLRMDRCGLTITAAHYPAGASKWNPIEHRMFSEITKNWAGVPLESFETIVNFASTTKTDTGLRVAACRDQRVDPKGRHGNNFTFWRERRMVRREARGAAQTRRSVTDEQRSGWPCAASPRRAAPLLPPDFVASLGTHLWCAHSLTPHQKPK